MKNRNWFCYALDIFGLAALASAGLVLLSALWYAGSGAEPLLMMMFRAALTAAVAAFVSARGYEIFALLKAAPKADEHAMVMLTNDNVEALPNRGRLPRAA